MPQRVCWLAGCPVGSHWWWRGKFGLQILTAGGQGHGLQGRVEVSWGRSGEAGVVQHSLCGPVPFAARVCVRAGLGPGLYGLGLGVGRQPVLSMAKP